MEYNKKANYNLEHAKQKEKAEAVKILADLIKKYAHQISEKNKRRDKL
ncbi:hypothetical protein [Virgibacillus alimentarius]|nr:hypothetical protein [Virgibacillus alimentarius]